MSIDELYKFSNVILNWVRARLRVPRAFKERPYEFIDISRFLSIIRIRKQFNFEPRDVVCLVPNETCMLMYKDNHTKED